jgi:predicted molibdopterin-dependent oxidoreductase YjgC
MKSKRILIAFLAVFTTIALGANRKVSAATKIQGKVTLEGSGTPLSGGVVTLLNDEKETIVFTQPDGSFEIVVDDEEWSKILKTGKILIKNHNGKNTPINNLNEQVANRFLEIEEDVDQSIFLSDIEIN